MEAILGGLPWDGISGWMLALLVVVGFMTGRLKTRRDYEDQVRRADQAEEGRRYWQQIAENRTRQVDTLLPSVDNATRFIEAIVEQAQDRGASDGDT